MTETATFAAGCFWGVEAAFRLVDGVIDTRVGYTGGHVDRPTYEQVCSGTTGHAEAVEVVFDPERLSFEQLVDVFFDCHNPTTLNRQGHDIGSQYRSAVFVHDAAQEMVVHQVISRLTASGRFRDPIVTTIVLASAFWPAEEYHQQYLEKSRGGASCRR